MKNSPSVMMFGIRSYGVTSVSIVFLTLSLLAFSQLSYGFVWKNEKRSNFLHPARINSRATTCYADKSKDKSIAWLEKQVMASAQAKVDVQRFTKAIDKNNNNDADYSELMLPDEPIPSSSFSVALAAAAVTSSLSILVFHDFLISLALAVPVFVVAYRDPMGENDDVSGPLARIIGRAGLKSWSASEPKVRAVARAVVTGEEEIAMLKDRVEQLEIENSELRLWRQRRNFVDKALPNYTVTDLKEQARVNGLPVGGAKSQLLMRLIEAEVIKI